MKISMERYGIAGWEWRVTGADEFGDPLCADYRTNSAGEGLWMWDLDRQARADAYTYIQVEGTGQFSLSEDRRQAYAQIRRRFAPFFNAAKAA